MTTSVLSTVLKAGSAARRSERRRAAQELSLSSELIECLHTSNFHDPAQGYFPIGRVRHLISPGPVEKELRRGNKEALDEEEDKDAVIDRICRQSYKTFATALFCGLESVALLDFMLEFQEKGLTDEHLPAVAEETIRECCWDDTKAHSFCIQRWKFLAPVFSPQKYDYDLPNDCIFPFAKDVTMSRSGAFGTVSRVEIHPDHQKHMNMRYVCTTSSLRFTNSHI
jgi:hypothetical protein